MTLWRVWLCLGVAALLFGCAGSPIKPVELNAPGDAAPLFQELETYNRPPGIVRALGRLRLEGMGGADYGARVEPGRGVRLDVVTGALARLVLSATCNNESGCDFYLPELNTVYREADPWATRWLAALVTGRVPMKEGMLSVACTSDCPCSSVMMQEKS